VADLLQQAVDWLDSVRTSHLSQTVTYQRGSESVQLAATLGSTGYEVSDDFGATVQARTTDFIVSADALVLDGQQAMPQPGDRISVTTGAKVLVFEVLALPGGEHYRPADPHGRMLRIHAKQVDEVLT